MKSDIIFRLISSNNLSLPSLPFQIPSLHIQIIKMIRRNKYILVFSIIYWLIALIGVVLFSVSFQKVPIGYCGLKANYFSPKIESSFYSPGLYDIGVGYYFILFPSTRQYLVDNQVAIINQNLEKLIVTYTLVYK